MKRTYTLIALLGILVGTLLTGCDSGSKAPDASASTNAPAPAAASTNK